MTVVTWILIGVSLLQAALHPALTPSPEALEKSWRAGYERARTDKTLYRAHRFAKRGIGRINGKTVSWVLFWHPRLRAFEQGFAARKNDATVASQENSLRGLYLLAEDGKKTLRFDCELGIYPRLGNGVQREARIGDLRGVKAALHVGDRVYPPVQQPSDVDPTDLVGIHKWTEQIPIGTRTVENSDGTTRTETEYMTLYREVKYRYFIGAFSLEFDLWNKDGTPRITERDTEITVVIEGAFGTQKATYRLKDWLNAYEK